MSTGKAAKHNAFYPPQTLRQYCLDVNGSAYVQEGSANGLLCSWDVLDAIAARGVPQFVVIGEHVRDGDGMRFSEIAVNPAWMREQGYIRSKEHGWHEPSEACDKERHKHVVPLRLVTP